MNKALRFTLISLGILAGVAVLVFAVMSFGPMRWNAFGGPGMMMDAWGPDQMPHGMMDAWGPDQMPHGMMDAWGPDQMPHGFMWDGGGRFMPAFFSPAWLIGGIIKVLLLVGGVLLLVRLLNRPVSAALMNAPAVDSGAGAVEILKARYARGEITREQYLEMLADIG